MKAIVEGWRYECIPNSGTLSVLGLVTPLLFVAATLSGKTTMKHSASLYCAILLSFGAATPLQAQMHYPTNLTNELGGHSISGLFRNVLGDFH